MTDFGRNILAMQALAARFRCHAAETSLEMFQRKFEAAAEELEREAVLKWPLRINFRGSEFPDCENDRGYGH
jgi:hypothetical protein